MQAILSFLAEIFSQPAFLMGLIAFVGLVALRSPGNKLLTGTLKPILGYLMLSAGAGVIVANLNPLGGIIEAGFNIRGVIPNNEAIVSVAQKMLGVETMSILLLGFIFNLIIARCTKYKYIFLTGHHSFFLACLFSAVLQAAEFHGWMLILIGDQRRRVSIQFSFFLLTAQQVHHRLGGALTQRHIGRQEATAVKQRQLVKGFNHDREANCRVQIAFRDNKAEAFSNQAEADHQQEAQTEDDNGRVAVNDPKP